MNPRRTILTVVIPAILIVGLSIGLVWFVSGAVHYDTTVHGTCRDGYAFDVTKTQRDDYYPADKLANTACLDHRGVQEFDRSFD
jgi:hypothetical protein